MANIILPEVANIEAFLNENSFIVEKDGDLFRLTLEKLKENLDIDGVTSNVQEQLNDKATKAELDAINWFDNGTSIPSGSDLDTYTTQGKYYAVNDATAESLINCPVTSNFVLYVYKRTSGSTNQLIMSRTGIHMRGNNTSGTWSAWKVSLNANSDGGALSVARGGTGAADGATGLANLFAAGNTVLSSYQYGTNLPAEAAVGQMFFKETTGTIADIGQDVAKAVRAVNLFDNSDFTNPVNQRGQTSYAGNVLTIDRWNLWSPNGLMTATVEDGCVRFWNGDTESGSFGQKFPTGTFDSEKSYTFAYMTTDGTIRVRNNPIEHYEWGEAVNIGLYPNETYLMVWAALYEGEYTLETLPPYVSDGYALEMVKSNGGAAAISKIWVNASPTSSFPEADLYFDLSDTQWLAFIIRTSGSSAIRNMFIVPVGGNVQSICKANAAASGNTINYVRLISTTTSGVSFGSTVKKSEGSTSITSDSNGYCIPVEIYAIKGVN